MTDPAVRARYVVLLPLTHTPTTGDTAGSEIPARVRRALGLNETPSWVIVYCHYTKIVPDELGFRPEFVAAG